MKYKYFIDFDGVILDTNDLVVKEIMEEIYDDGLNEIFEELDWYELYKKAPVISDNLEILKKMQYEYDCSILTKIKHLNEGIAKIKFLRNLGINIPIILVPIHNKKTDVIKPQENYILIDDDLKNIVDWECRGGIAINYIPELMYFYTENSD